MEWSATSKPDVSGSRLTLGRADMVSSLCGRVRCVKAERIHPCETKVKDAMLCILPSAAAWEPSDRSRALARLIEETRERMKLTRAQFAGELKLSERQLSDCLTLKRPFNVYRLGECAGFFRIFLDVLAEAEDCLVFEKKLVTLILTVESRPKVMAKAELDTHPQQKAVGGR
jgi:hypothetical protein